MFTLKVISTLVLIGSIIAKMVMDFFWKDGRTNRYKLVRNCFIITALIAAVLNGYTLLVEDIQKRQKADEEQKQRIEDDKRRTEIENLTLGALTPNVSIELHSTPGFPPNPLLRFGAASTNDPPDSLVVSIENTNVFPIYDVWLSLMHDLAHREAPSTVTENFNKEVNSMYPIIRPWQIIKIVMPWKKEYDTSVFYFTVYTRRGRTVHDISLALVTNQWEMHRVVFEMNHPPTNQVLFDGYTPGFPKGTNGYPISLKDKR